jgi:hypothetical protein
MKLEQLIELAGEVESQDPIDWGMLNISEDEALKLIAIDVLEMFNSVRDSEDRDNIMLATVTKLVLENFVLQLKLLERKRHGSKTF